MDFLPLSVSEPILVWPLHNGIGLDELEGLFKSQILFSYLKCSPAKLVGEVLDEVTKIHQSYKSFLVCSAELEMPNHIKT